MQTGTVGTIFDIILLKENNIDQSPFSVFINKTCQIKSGTASYDTDLHVLFTLIVLTSVSICITTHTHESGCGSLRNVQQKHCHQSTVE
jgi:hypothetical protein